MKNKIILWLLLSCFTCATGQAETGVLSQQLKGSLMKQLLGHWDIKDESKDQQGNWQAGAGASWYFYSILNGHAVQDDWISPPLDQPEPSTGRQYGTNIRIYNPKQNRWEMAWASVKGQKVDTFVAAETADQIIMTGLFNGQDSRITFYDIKTNHFSWKLEFKQADGSWAEVYRIYGSRRIKSA